MEMWEVIILAHYPSCVCVGVHVLCVCVCG